MMAQFLHLNVGLKNLTRRDLKIQTKGSVRKLDQSFGLFRLQRKEVVCEWHLGPVSAHSRFTAAQLKFISRIIA